MNTANDRLLKPTGAQIMPLQVLDFGYEATGFGVFPAGLLLYEEEQAESHCPRGAWALCSVLPG